MVESATAEDRLRSDIEALFLREDSKSGLLVPEKQMKRDKMGMFSIDAVKKLCEKGNSIYYTLLKKYCQEAKLVSPVIVGQELALKIIENHPELAMFVKKSIDE